MSVLLKDMPECMEKIENNQSLINEIKETLSDASFSFELDKDDNSIMGEIDNPTELSETILEKLTDFINQNYTWKGIKN